MGQEPSRTAGQYEYTRDLLQLEAYRPKIGPVASIGLLGELSVVKTPLRVQEWEEALRYHPDRKLVGFLLRSMTQGFRIGFNPEAVTLESTKHNMRSAAEEPEVVRSYLQAERDAGRGLGPVSEESGGKLVHVSRFGVIPKPYQPGKWRLMVDLSYPPQYSVNDGVHPRWCSLEYASIDQAAATVLRLGQGA